MLGRLRSRTNRGTAVLVGAILVATAAGCGGGAGSSGDAVKVGLLGNFTGGAAESFGVPFERGFQLGLANAKAAGAFKDAGVSIEVLKEDAKSEVPSAVTGFNKLSQKRVPVVINDSQSPLGQAVAPLANDGKVAFLSGAGSKLENKDGFAFRFTDLGTPTAATGAYLTKSGAKRVGVIVASDNPSFATLADATEAGLPDGFSSRQEVSANDSDFSAVLANLRKDKVDAVVLSVLPAQAGNIILQMKQSGGFDGVKLAGTVATSSETYTIAGDAAADFVFPQVWAPGADGASGFEAAYQKKYGEVPTAYGALGYQTAWIISAAIIAATAKGEVTGTSIRDALPAASTSELVKSNGILDLTLKADGSAVSNGNLASFTKDGTMTAVTAK